MNIEFYRRETAKKNMGLTEFPTENKPVTIAKGLEPIDFMGMIIQHDSGIAVINNIGITREETGEIHHITIDNSLLYYPETGELRLNS